MQTIAEFARKIDVSLQTVYRHVNKLSDEIAKEAIVQKGNKLYITDFGEPLLTERIMANKGVSNPVKHPEEVLNDPVNLSEFELNPVKHPETPINPPVNIPEWNEIGYLLEQNQMLREELIREREHSRAQSDKLADLADRLAQIAQNSQVLMAAETAAEARRPPKKRQIMDWLQKIFLKADG